MSSEMVEGLRTGDVTLGVVGLGYVGLPLAVDDRRVGKDDPGVGVLAD